MIADPRIASNILWLLAERGARLGIAFVVSLWVARGLGPETFGVFGYAQATVSVLSFLAFYAIEAIVVRELADTPTARDEILGSAAVLRLAGGALCIVAVAITTQLLAAGEPIVRLIAPIIAAATALQAFDVIEYWLRLKLLSRLGVALKIAALVVGGLLRVLAVQTAEPLVALALAILAESMLVAAGLMLAARYADSSIRHWRPRWSMARHILRQASPMLLAALAVSIYVRVGVIILGNISGAFQVGLLGVATLVTEAFHALAVAAAASYGPLVLSRRKASREAFDADVVRLMRHFVLASVAIAAVVTIVAEPAMRLLFGEQYEGSGRLLAVLIWSIVFVYISVASELWFVGHGLQKYLAGKTMISAVLFVVLCLTLIPAHGAMGVAFATLGCYSFSALFSNLIYAETRPLFRRQLHALAVFRAAPSRA
jgi:O-antigen/teichoic acid export membrane protein